MLIPGETALHSFAVPFNLESISKIIVTYKQNDHIVFEKTITSASTDVIFSEENNTTSFSFRLTQQQSLLFEDDNDYSIQINVLSNSNVRAVSNIIKSKSGSQYVRTVI